MNKVNRLMSLTEKELCQKFKELLSCSGYKEDSFTKACKEIVDKEGRFTWSEKQKAFVCKHLIIHWKEMQEEANG